MNCQHRKFETFERNWKNRVWYRFTLSHRGRISWADWFYMSRKFDNEFEE